MNYDFSLSWGGDFNLSPTAGLELISGAALTQQRLVRRLLTNPGDYLEDLTYGAGLGRYVGQPVNAAAIQGMISTQALLEESVLAVTSVTIATDNGLGLVSATIAYTASNAAGTQFLTVPS
jgi:phage baseplate assembly protein W